MPLYILRHKPTNHIMPILRRNKGYTYWNPDNPREVGTPRLFSNKTAAINAVRWWEEGQFYYSYDMDGDPTLRYRKVEGRKGMLEIVEVKLVEVG